MFVKLSSILPVGPFFLKKLWRFERKNKAFAIIRYVKFALILALTTE